MSIASVILASANPKWDETTPLAAAETDAVMYEACDSGTVDHVKAICQSFAFTTCSQSFGCA